MFKLKIRTKLVFLILIFYIAMGAVGFMGIQHLKMVIGSAQYLYEQSIVGIIKLSKADTQLRENALNALFYFLSKDETQKQSLKTLINTQNENLKIKLDEYKQCNLDEIQQIQVKSLESSLLEYNEFRENMMAESERGQDVSTLLNDLIIKQSRISNALGILQEYQKNRSQEIYDSSLRVYNQSLNSLLWIMLASVAVTLVFAVVIYLSLTKPLNRLTTAAQLLEQGDLRSQIKATESKTEIGRLMTSFAAALSNLRELVVSTNEIALGVAEASNELSRTAEETGQGASQVAVSMEELARTSQEHMERTRQMATAVESMLNTVTNIKESYAQAKNDVEQASTLADRGQKEVETAVAQMDIIKNSAYDMGEKVAALEGSSQKISEIVDMISAIAQQTNLLALNAAIEAARAGEQGRGFAVVAEEVRKLAEESERSAQQIAGLIQDIQNGIKNAMASMQRGADEVNKGTHTIETSGRAFLEISGSVKSINAAIKRLGDAAEEIYARSSEVEKLIASSVETYENIASHTEKVSATAQQQAAAMEEVVASASHLSGLADGLKNAVERFKV